MASQCSLLFVVYISKCIILQFIWLFISHVSALIPQKLWVIVESILSLWISHVGILIMRVIEDSRNHRIWIYYSTMSSMNYNCRSFDKVQCNILQYGDSCMLESINLCIIYSNICMFTSCIYEFTSILMDSCMPILVQWNVNINICDKCKHKHLYTFSYLCVYIYICTYIIIYHSY